MYITAREKNTYMQLYWKNYVILNKQGALEIT